MSFFIAALALLVALFAGVLIAPPTRQPPLTAGLPSPARRAPATLRPAAAHARYRAHAAAARNARRAAPAVRQAHG